MVKSFPGTIFFFQYFFLFYVAETKFPVILWWLYTKIVSWLLLLSCFYLRYALRYYEDTNTAIICVFLRKWHYAWLIAADN